MPKGKHNSPKPKRVLPKKAEEFAEKFEAATKFWDPNQEGAPFPFDPPNTEEEMKKFTQGFAYTAPGKEWTKCKDKLPGDLQHVLVLCGGCWGQGSYDPLRQIYSFMIFQAYFHSSSGWHLMGGVQNCNVFAWREIPPYPHEWLEEFKNHG